MMDLSTAPRTRLLTAFGTVLYVDAVAGEMRHGPIESSPANAVFVADPSSAAPHRRGWLMYDEGGSCEPLLRLEDCRLAVPRSEGASRSAPAAVLGLIPLERGLLAVKADDFFLSALPDGRIRLSKPVCSTWELFLASEAWCTDAPTGDGWIGSNAGKEFDKKRIVSYIVHPLIRVRARTKPKARRILVYGYTKWSHGRVYYDLCTHLHRYGYIVDILDWRVNHIAYFNDIKDYYELFITALDGVSTLTDTYGVPYDRIIALSHHEFDIRMLAEKKGIEVFAKFANYGVVSEYLYGASLMRGVPRTPMVAALGINFSEFRAELPARLAAVGYAGSMSVETFGVEWKRGELAKESARDAELAFKVAGWTGNQISFHDMPDFYKTVDAVLITSMNEGAGLPAIEAAAAGRLVIGTPVGHFPLKAYQGAGIIAPIEAEKFKNFTTATLRFYKENPAAFVAKCRGIQAAARKFDWQYTIGDWVELIEAAMHGYERPSEPGAGQSFGKQGNVPERPHFSQQHQNTANIVSVDSKDNLGPIYVINLDESADRFQKFQEQNSHLKHVVRFSAVDGKVVDKSKLVSAGIVAEDVSYSPGSLGCALSHVKLWQETVAKECTVTIFEDDVICSHDFRRRAQSLLSSIKNKWDIVHWGYNYHPLFMWLDFGFAKAKLETYDRQWSGKRRFDIQTADIAPTPMKIAHVFGAMGYSVSPRGARALLDYCLPLRKRHIRFPGTNVVIEDTGIDCPMCGVYPSMDAFASVPPLVLHDDAQASVRVAADQRR